MRIDTQLSTDDLAALPSTVRDLEAAGFDGLWTSETAHDPFLPLVAASYGTSRIRLGTAVAIAFARNPMTVAYTAHDLQRYTRGRFSLGLGSQVKAHVEKRFSMPWGQPVARMREFVVALREIWRCWQDGTRLRFDGDFYRHSLMTPFFTPQHHGFGPPPVLLAAVGPAMTRLAAEVADGVFLHSFCSPDYVRARLVPMIADGVARSGRSRARFEVASRVFVASGRDAAEIDANRRAVRRQIAFYASTPAYRPVLDFHGLGDLGDELHRVSRTADDSRWDAMTGLVPDKLFDALVVVGSPAEVVAGIGTRYADIADRVRVYAPYPAGAAVERAVMEHMRAAGPGSGNLLDS